jgi:branched-chain amino acid transport system permease protein
VTTFLTLLWSGISQGADFALVALGFTVIYRSSRVINFAHGELLALGAFVVSSLVSHGWNFAAAFVAGIVVTAAVGMAFQTVVLRWALGRPDFTIVMLTLGFATVLTAVIDTAFGDIQRSNGDPWGLTTWHLGSVSILEVSVWSVVVTIVVLAAFFAFNRYSRYGLAMRAAAHDSEAALAVGIPLRRVYALSWTIAGGLACIAGVFLGAAPSSVDPTIGNVALLAFPAIILGGLDSVGGAVIGGMVIGLVQQLVQGYQPDALGKVGFYDVAPYIVMVIVLLVRPYGLFGSKPAERL